MDQLRGCSTRQSEDARKRENTTGRIRYDPQRKSCHVLLTTCGSSLRWLAVMMVVAPNPREEYEGRVSIMC